MNANGTRRSELMKASSTRSASGMALRIVSLFAIASGLLANTACTLELPSFNLPTGPFLLKGTYVQVDRFGQPPCFAWEGDNGVFYHLFQDADLDDDLFDQATTVGARSRLLIEIRSDLQVSCELGPTVEVLEVREIISGA